MKRSRILFILKLRDDSYGCSPYSYGDGLSSGLFNSARMVVDMLTAAGIDAKLVQVIDNNDIDREVRAFRALDWFSDVKVVIEGLWVVPEKFRELIPLHPHVQWIVRIHSEIPFLAMEGVALDWIAKYLLYENVYVAVNSDRGFQDIANYSAELLVSKYWSDKNVLFLPNYYPVTKPWWRPHDSETISIGCFGAIRPLKNQLIQAMAAIEFARQRNKRLRFYITVRDCEQGGDQVLKNIRALFANTGTAMGIPHELIERPWMPHEDFLGILDLIDVGMAVSLSESFCIVAADMVNAGVPVVVSPEIRWASWFSKANATDTFAIVRTLNRVTRGFPGEGIRHLNRDGLLDYSSNSRRTWLEFLRK